MAGLDKTIVDFSLSGAPNSGSLAIGASSTTAAVPANTELLMITTTGNSHFRIGVGTQTALVTDPLLTTGICLVIKLDPSQSYNIAAISDPVTITNGTLSFYRVYEG